MNKPEVSIIVPIYNAEKFLCPCLDSILAQTFINFEIILIDDGSTDNCGRICDNYAKKDDRVRVFHKINEGVSASRNLGLSIANGDYISFIDSDDFIHPQMIELLYTEIYKNKCSFSMVIEESVFEHNYTIKKPQITKYSIEKINKDDCVFKLTHEGKEKRNFVHLLGKLYRKTLLSGILFDKEISLSEDLLFNMEFYLKDGNGVQIMEPMYYRTLLRTDSLSSQKPTDMIYNAEIYFKSLSLIPTNETTYRSYVLVNIMNRITNFKKRNKNTNLKKFAQSKSKELFNLIKWELWVNNKLSILTKLKLIFNYYKV